ncbi:MAG: hypothetical protein PVH63_08170 [Balneolaceae bacterium]
MIVKPAIAVTKTGGLKMIKLIRAIAIFIPFFLLLIFVSQSHAQEKEISTQVTAIAGSTIYLSSGSNDGIIQGDTLYVYRGDTFLGALLVHSVASTSLSAEFESDTFAVTRGQNMLIRFEKPRMQGQTNEEKQEIDKRKKSILSNSQNRVSNRDVEHPNISGRIAFGGHALFSSTKWNNVQNKHTNRLFITPYTNVSAFIRNLPGGLNFDASMAYSYRYSNSSTINPSSWARFYRLNLEKRYTNIPLTITAGRFYNQYEIFSGFWDGVMAKVGDRHNGIGLIAGFEPIRSDEGFQTDLPKYSIYTYQEFQVRKFRSSTELNFTAITPAINLNNHLYVGAYQQFILDRNRISLRLKADQNPQSKGWEFSQIMVRGTFSLAGWLKLHGGYNQRRPYLMYRNGNPIGYRRTQITGGTRILTDYGNIGADFTRISSELNSTAYAVSGYAQKYRSNLWKLGFSVNAQYWYNDTFNTIRLAPGIHREFNNFYLSLGYEFYRTDFASDQYQTHTVDLSASVNLSSNWYFQTNLRSGYGELFINNSLQFSIWRSF